MTISISQLSKYQFNQNGIPLAGGKLFTYAAGTTTKLSTYTDSTGITPNSNPIILDSNGQCDIWLPGGTLYKYVLSPPTDTDPPTNPFWVEDNQSAPGSASNGTVLSVSVATTNGFAGTVTNPTTLPQITIFAGVTGMIKGNGIGILTATPGVDYVGIPTNNTLTGLNKFTGLATFNGAFADVAFPTGVTASGVKVTRSAPSGGTGGGTDVRTALFVGATNMPDTANYEWAFLSEMNNWATAGENVAAYAKGYKYANGPTWAGVLESKDFSSVKFTGSIAGTTLTVTGIYYGATIQVGNHITGSGVAAYTVVTAILTGSGGIGTYTVSVSQTVTSRTLWTGGVLYGLEIDVWADGYDGTEIRRGIGFNFGNIHSDSCQIAYGIDFAAKAGVLANASLGSALNIQINCDVAGITWQNTAIAPCIADLTGAGPIGALLKFGSTTQSSGLWRAGAIGALNGGIKVMIDGNPFYIPVYA